MTPIQSTLTLPRLLVPKAFYFFIFAALASLSPFLTIYYQEIGLTGSQIGLLTGAPPFVALLGAPFMGGLADATQQYRRLLNLSLVGAVFGILGVFLSEQFFWLLPCTILYAFFFVPIFPLVDHSVLKSLGNQKTLYGRQRLWGSIGWGVAAPIAGYLIEQTSLNWAFYIFFILMGVVFLISFYLPVSRAGIGQEFWKGVKLLAQNKGWSSFLVAVFIIGIGDSIVHHYLFLYMHDLGASKTLIGWTLTVGTLSELAVMFFSARILARWDTQWLLILGICALAMRGFAYAYIPVLSVIIVVQLLHGITFGLLWVTCVAHADKLSQSSNMGATAQGTLNGIKIGLGSATGAVLGGVFYEKIGAAKMFEWMGILVLLGCLFFAFAGRNSN